MDMTTISSAVASLKAAKDIAQGMLALKSLSEVQGKVIELQSTILEAQGKALDAQADMVRLNGQLDELKTQLEALQSHKDFVATLHRAGGAYVAVGDPDPYCPRCIEASITPVHLIKTGRLELRIWVWACPQCKTELAWRNE